MTIWSYPSASDEKTAVLRVRAMANCRRAEEASTEAERLVERHPFSTELHFLHALLHLDLKRYDAAAALRRVLYLDRSLVVAKLLLASVLRRLGRIDEARRMYTKVRDLAKACPADKLLPFGEGERAGTLARIADSELALLRGRYPRES